MSINVERKYSKNTDKILINSAKNARFDFKLLKYKTETAVDNEMMYIELNFELDSLKDNLETIKQIDVSKLPKDQSENYQVYRADLNGLIYKTYSELRFVSKNQDTTMKDTDKLELTKENRELLSKSFDRSYQVIRADEVAIENGDSIRKKTNHYDEKYIDELVENGYPIDKDNKQ